MCWWCLHKLLTLVAQITDSGSKYRPQEEGLSVLRAQVPVRLRGVPSGALVCSDKDVFHWYGHLGILKSRANWRSCMCCTSGAQFWSCRRLVILLVYICLMNLAPRCWIISRALMSLARWGSQAVALYSRWDLSMEMKASPLNCSGQWYKFLQSKPMMLFAF